jgi:hypothetical protein
MVPRWHHADSELRHSWLSFDTKNKTIDNIWRFHWYLPDYIPYDWSKCITSTTWSTRNGNLDWEGLYHEISSQRIKNTKNYILKLPSNVQTNFNPFHIFSAVVKVRHERDEIPSKLNMRTIGIPTKRVLAAVLLATMNIGSNEEINKSVLKSGNTPGVRFLLCLVGTVCLHIT